MYGQAPAVHSGGMLLVTATRFGRSNNLPLQINLAVARVRLVSGNTVHGHMGCILAHFPRIFWFVHFLTISSNPWQGLLPEMDCFNGVIVVRKFLDTSRCWSDQYKGNPMSTLCSSLVGCILYLCRRLMISLSSVHLASADSLRMQMHHHNSAM
jgi:hypothetical protein